MLHDVHLDISNLLPGIIADHNVGSNFLPVVVELLVQSNFEVDLTAWESEALRHQRAWQTANSTTRWSKLEFLDGQLNDAALVALIIFVGTNVAFNKIFNSQGFSLVVLTWKMCLVYRVGKKFKLISYPVEALRSMVTCRGNERWRGGRSGPFSWATCLGWGSRVPSPCWELTARWRWPFPCWTWRPWPRPPRDHNGTRWWFGQTPFSLR